MNQIKLLQEKNRAEHGEFCQQQTQLEINVSLLSVNPMVKSGGRNQTLMLVSLLLNRRGRFVFVIHSLVVFLKIRKPISYEWPIVVFLKIRKPISYENFPAVKRNEESGKKTNLHFSQRFHKYWRFGKKLDLVIQGWLQV